MISGKLCGLSVEKLGKINLNKLSPVNQQVINRVINRLSTGYQQKMNTNFEATNKKWKTNNNNTIIYKYIIIGNEKRIIPVGDPPPGTDEKPNLENLKKLAELKVPLLKKLSMQKDEGTNSQKTSLPVL